MLGFVAWAMLTRADIAVYVRALQRRGRNRGLSIASGAIQSICALSGICDGCIFFIVNCCFFSLSLIDLSFHVLNHVSVFSLFRPFVVPSVRASFCSIIPVCALFSFVGWICRSLFVLSLFLFVCVCVPFFNSLFHDHLSMCSIIRLCFEFVVSRVVRCCYHCFFGSFVCSFVLLFVLPVAFFLVSRMLSSFRVFCFPFFGASVFSLERFGVGMFR